MCSVKVLVAYRKGEQIMGECLAVPNLYNEDKKKSIINFTTNYMPVLE